MSQTLIAYESETLVTMLFLAYSCHICLFTIKTGCGITKKRLSERGLKHWIDQPLINPKILGYEDVGPFACLGPQWSALALLVCWTLLISPANFCSHWEDRLETGGSEALEGITSHFQ